jgi:acyl-[acyl-carrier-protein]-phospholipid O-acyltransferase/long-chain-fatty-acid--[acyl-carrier-protein] ligase
MQSGSYKTTLSHAGLKPFLVTQFLGALNDNVLKIIVSFDAMATMGPATGAAVVGAVFIAPFLLFSGYAGHLADRMSKNRVLLAIKWFEVGVMALAAPGILTGRVGWLLAALFLMGVHSTFFSPAKYGIVPELLPDDELSRANGLLEMSTFAAIVLGTSIGGELFDRWHGRPVVMASALVVIAIAGVATAWRIPTVRAARPHAPLSLNPIAEVWRGTVRMWPDRTLWMTMVGISYFWFLGALLQMALLPFGQVVLHVSDAAATRLYTPLAVGIAAGSLLAGRLSGRKIELGLVPIGAFGLAAFSFLLAGSTTYELAATALAILGVFGGFFAVPLNALLQQRPNDDEKGRVLATNNFYNTVGILGAAAALAIGDELHLTMPHILAIAGGVTLLSTAYLLYTLPDFFTRFVLWCLTHTIYRIRILGEPNIPAKGPALLICNHVSLVDGALVGACIQRFVRFIVWAPYFRNRALSGVMRRLHAIPIAPGQKRAVVDALAQARQALVDGHVVCIFVEGSISRTGNLLPFKRGFERVADGLDVPVIPVYLDRVWGSIFSFTRERFVWKLPQRLPYPVTVAFGPPLAAAVSADDARLAMMELGAQAAAERRPATARLHLEFAETARRHWFRPALADSLGRRLTYGRALTASLMIANEIGARAGEAPAVGVLLPASVGGALVNIAAAFAGKVPVNLNFTAGPAAMAAALADIGATITITSKMFLKKAAIDAQPGMIFLEDLVSASTSGAKVRALLRARLMPMRSLSARPAAFGSTPSTAPPTAAIIYSSGSTGTPKGVMLSHANILSNVDALGQVYSVTKEDAFLGVLPFFHAFGVTGTLWFPLLRGARVVFHPNPMDAKTIGELAAEHGVTLLISTPTFCSSYLRRCTREQFGRLRHAIVGAEKLRPALAAEFLAHFGVPLLEGYGCTEMAPVIAVNRPNVDDGPEHQIGTKAGSVGHPIPGVAVKVIDQPTGARVPAGEEGLILVKGPNLMQGYLHQPERTAEAMRDGWYVTGDIGVVDEDGFLFVTDRASRFSKIGGEMVPHMKIEDAINEAIGEPCAAVTSVPDEARGERIVACYTRADVAPAALWERLCATDLPRLWLPRRESLFVVDAIPTLGTGKVDLRGVRALAMSRMHTS